MPEASTNISNRILVVDDDADLRELLKLYLSTATAGAAPQYFIESGFSY